MRQTFIPALAEKKGTQRGAIERASDLLTQRCETSHRYRREVDVSHGTALLYPCYPRKSQGCINNEGIGDPAVLSPQAAGGGSFGGARDIRRNGSGRVPGFAD